MQLIIGGNKVNEEVTNSLIERSIWGLKDETDSFAILEKDEMHYIQTSGDSENGFILEYQNGSIEEHFTCTNEPIDTNRVIKAFQSYLAQDRKWITEYTWEKENLSSSGGRSAIVVMAVLGFIIVAGALMLWQSA